MCSPKNPIFRRKGQEKPIYRNELPDKGELGQFADLRRGLGKKDGDVVFDGGCLHFNNLIIFVIAFQA